MLPSINSLKTDFGGLPGDSAASLPVADDSGSPFAGILRQSVAAKPLAEQSLPAGSTLPPDGRKLPVDAAGSDLPVFEIELPGVDWFGQDLITMGSPESNLYNLDLVPQPIVAAIASELGEVSEELQAESGRTIGDLANADRSGLASHWPAPIEPPVDPAAPPITPSLALIAEQRWRERNGSLEISRVTGPVTSRPTDIGWSGIDVLPRGHGAAQSPLTPVPVTDLLNLMPTSMPDGPAVAIQASRIAADALSGGSNPFSGTATDASAALNNSSLPAHVSLASTAPVNTTASVPAGAAAMHIGTPLHDAGWGSELGSRVVQMSGQQLQSARIQLSPAELGPITVNLVVDDGSAELTFHAQHGLTRDAIEQALPRLREMLNDNGLTLGNATVSDQGVARDGSGHASGEARVGDWPGDDAPGGDESSAGQPVRVLQGLLDTFV